jgi:hypothetical protein
VTVFYRDLKTQVNVPACFIGEIPHTVEVVAVSLVKQVPGANAKGHGQTRRYTNGERRTPIQQ